MYYTPAPQFSHREDDPVIGRSGPYGCTTQWLKASSVLSLAHKSTVWAGHGGKGEALFYRIVV